MKRLLHKPQQKKALQLLSTARRDGAKLCLKICSVWILSALLWVRWPIYYRTLFPALETKFGDKFEVEPAVVTFAIVLPFLLAGTVFYWKQSTVGSMVRWGRQLRLVKWVQTHPSIGKSVGFDAVDVVLVGGFCCCNLTSWWANCLSTRKAANWPKRAFAPDSARVRHERAVCHDFIRHPRGAPVVLHKFFGLSGERAARYHVLTGQFGFIMLMLHGVLYLYVWYMQGKVEQMLFPCLDESCTPKQRYGSTRNFFGAVAIWPLIIVAVSSMEWVRRRFFRRFVMLHCLSAILWCLRGCTTTPQCSGWCRQLWCTESTERSPLSGAEKQLWCRQRQ